MYREYWFFFLNTKYTTGARHNILDTTSVPLFSKMTSNQPLPLSFSQKNYGIFHMCKWVFVSQRKLVQVLCWLCLICVRNNTSITIAFSILKDY
jgi:hypothetical protein